MPDPLLTTKFLLPAVRSGAVPRLRLITRLDQAVQAPLTLISAPAGFGKTTLVVSWRECGAGKDFPMAWLSLDAGDNHPQQFFGYLIAALEKLSPGMVAQSAALLQSRQLPAPEILMTTLINEISAVQDHFALVLEDYHFINQESLHQAMAFLVEHLPPAMHLVLVTRLDPPLPLSRLRARGQLLEIRAADMRFDVQEAGQFLNEAMRLALSRQQVETLYHRTEGWITGLQLAGLSLQACEREHIPGFIDNFSGSNRYILDYLTDEVLGSQPETVQSFLLETSILDRLNESLCSAVTGRIDSQAMLERLEQSNLFLSALDERRQWYRYHHLFADLLRNRLQRSTPERMPDLHRRASQWHLENGQTEQALLHANAIPDYALSCAIIEQAAGALKMISGWGQILYWIQSIPGQEFDLRPNLALLKAWGLVFTDQTDDVDALLDIVEQALQGGAELAAGGNWRGQMLVIRARLAYLQGQFNEAIELSHRAAEIVNAGDLTRRYFLWMTLGLSYVAAGDLAQASQALEEANRCSARMDSASAELEAIGTLAEVQEILGKLHQAAATYRRILQLSGERIDLSVLSAHYHLGNVLYAWYQLDEAQQHLDTCLSQARLMRHPEAGVLALLWLARIALARGEAVRAVEIVQQIEAEAMAKPESIASPYITGSLMLLKHSLGGEVGKAAADLDEVSPPQDLQHRPFLYHKPLYQAQVRRLVASNRAAQAESYLELLLPIAETSGDALGVIELLSLKALALQLRGQSSGALVALAQALQRAEPEGYAAAFLELGAPMVELLRRAQAERIRPEYVSRLLALVEQHASAPLPGLELIEPLSQRELEILRLIAAGKSNQEIAAELVLAVGTVKKHLNNIFGKLGVQSRTQCVLRAQELRLV